MNYTHSRESRGERRSMPPQSATLLSNRADQGLPQVMREISDLMGGAGAILALYPGDGEQPILLHNDPALDGREAVMLDLCRAVRANFDGRCFWRDPPGNPSAPVLMMPVDRAAGHGQLMIAVLFDDPSADVRRQAEELHRDRRPFAVGYFHLWQAHRALTQRTKALETVLDQLAIGVLLLDRSARIVFANHTGAEVLATGDGLTRSGDVPRATNLSDGINLQAALSHAAAHAFGQPGRAAKAPLLSFRRRSGPPLVSALLPARNELVQTADVATIMYIVDPVFDTADMLTPLCRLHGLSPVETTLACRLASGETLAGAAARMHIKEATARGYLKTIFIKTDTKRQTELVALLLSSFIRMENNALLEALTPSMSDAATRHFS